MGFFEALLEPEAAEAMEDFTDFTDFTDIADFYDVSGIVRYRLHPGIPLAGVKTGEEGTYEPRSDAWGLSSHIWPR